MPTDDSVPEGNCKVCTRSADSPNHDPEHDQFAHAFVPPNQGELFFNAENPMDRFDSEEIEIRRDAAR